MSTWEGSVCWAEETAGAKVWGRHVAPLLKPVTQECRRRGSRVGDSWAEMRELTGCIPWSFAPWHGASHGMFIVISKARLFPVAKQEPQESFEWRSGCGPKGSLLLLQGGWAAGRQEQWYHWRGSCKHSGERWGSVGPGCLEKRWWKGLNSGVFQK